MKETMTLCIKCKGQDWKQITNLNKIAVYHYPNKQNSIIGYMNDVAFISTEIEDWEIEYEN